MVGRASNRAQDDSESRHALCSQQAWVWTAHAPVRIANTHEHRGVGRWRCNAAFDERHCLTESAARLSLERGGIAQGFRAWNCFDRFSCCVSAMSHCLSAQSFGVLGHGYGRPADSNTSHQHWGHWAGELQSGPSSPTPLVPFPHPRPPPQVNKVPVLANFPQIKIRGLRRAPPSGPGPDSNRQIFCRQSLSYCRQSLSTVARFVIWWMLQTNSWACRQTLSAAVLQTNFVSRFCRQTLSAVYTVHSTQYTVYSTQTMFVVVMKK